MTRWLKWLVAPLVVIGAMALAAEKQAQAGVGISFYSGGYPGYSSYSYYSGYPGYRGYPGCGGYGSYYNTYRPGYTFSYGFVPPVPRVYYYRPPIVVPGFPTPYPHGHCR